MSDLFLYTEAEHNTSPYQGSKKWSWFTHNIKCIRPKSNCQEFACEHGYMICDFTVYIYMSGLTNKQFVWCTTQHYVNTGLLLKFTGPGITLRKQTCTKYSLNSYFTCSDAGCRKFQSPSLSLTEGRLL